MPAARTARERARAEITAEIKRSARRRVSESGAAQLSLRAVARELEMSSSAVYRYFATRDELLTALIVDSYVALADALETVDAAAAVPTRWTATCATLRDWATAHPHEYALIYGSPIPGYAAPQQTIDPATRVIMAFVRVAADAPDRTGPSLDSPVLTAQLTAVVDGLALQLPPWRVLAVLQSLAQLIGAISLELFGHLVGSMDPAREFYAATVARCADLLELS